MGAKMQKKKLTNTETTTTKNLQSKENKAKSFWNVAEKNDDAGNPANGPSRRASPGCVFSLWESRAFPGQGGYVARPVRLTPTPGVSHQSKVLAGPRGGNRIRRSEPSQMADYWSGSTLSSHHSSRLGVGCLRRDEMQPIWRP